MSFYDESIETAHHVVTWIPDPNAVKRRQEIEIRRYYELAKYNIPVEPPCNDCPIQHFCKMECSKFLEYCNAPMSVSKKL
jgi:hypothetical protein